MKKFIRWTLAIAVLGIAAQWNAVVFGQFGGGFSFGDMSSGVREERATLTIRSDGTSRLETEGAMTRAMVEQMVRMFERFEAMGDDEEPKPAVTEPKPLTDEQLTAKFRNLMKTSDDKAGGDSAEKAKIQVDKDLVHISTARDFGNLEELLKDARSVWNQSGLNFEDVRFETTNSQFRITLVPYSGGQRYAKAMRQQWKIGGTKIDFKMVLPGKILSSGFPVTQDNATSLAIDGKKDESIDAALKLYDAPVVVAAEPGGLKLDHPLESKALWRQTRNRGEPADELPITDAAPGFVAEPASVTITTLHVFPGAEKFVKAGNGFFAQTGVVVNAKLFAPKGRTLQSVSGVRVLKAVDDKGRAVVAQSENDEGGESYGSYGRSRQVSAMSVALQLALPQPDAQAIDELSAEAIAVTTGSWKEMTLTNLQENATNEINLSDVLPGAKMVVTRFSFKGGQLNVQAELKGPKTVRRLDVQAKMPGNQEFDSSLFESNYRAQSTEATRKITVQGYLFSENRSAMPPMVIVVRYPEDQRRERVNFKLKGLDLM